jgi:Zn-finger nucleic acid-binding protein
MTEPTRTPTGGVEARWPCPVCLGVAMEKARLEGPTGGLTLDHCPRCGGVWFERGEPRQLAAHPPERLWERVPRRATAPRPPCHECHAPLDRDAERCATCGAANVLACPQCDRTMERRLVDGGRWVLDVCRRCRGVWFDHVELEALWAMNLDAAASRHGRLHPVGTGAVVAGDVLLDALVWNPHWVIYGAQGMGHAVAASAETLGAAASHAPEAAVAAVHVAGEAAASVFETIVEIISSLFD